MNKDTAPEWLLAARERGWGTAITVVLDILEPLGPLAAQLMLIAQPMASVFGGGPILRGLADTLDEPGGVERLRRHLAD